MLFSLLRVSWVMPFSLCAMLESWSGIVGKGRCRGVAGMAPSCLLLPHVVHLKGEKSPYFQGHRVIVSTQVSFFESSL